VAGEKGAVPEGARIVLVLVLSEAVLVLGAERPSGRAQPGGTENLNRLAA